MADLSPSRKRKRSSEEHISVRKLLVDIRTGDPNAPETALKLRRLSTLEFPRRDEWILAHFLTLVNCQQKNPPSVSVVRGAWRDICALILNLPSTRLKVCLRKTDLVQSLGEYLAKEQPEHITTSLGAAVLALKKLRAARETKRLLFTTLEKTYSALLQVTKVHLGDDVLKEQAVAILADVLLSSSIDRATPKKLLDTMLEFGLHGLSSYLQENPTSQGARHLFLASVFGESALTDSKVLQKIISNIGSESDVSEIRKLSFDSVPVSIKSSSKQIEIRNSLLEIWLNVCHESLCDSVLRAYRDSNLDIRTSRPLSNDPSLKETLSRCVHAALSSNPSNVDFIIVMLQVDLDVIIGQHDSKVWEAIKISRDPRLMQKWLEAHIEVRLLPQYLEKLVQVEIDSATLTQHFLNTFATEVSKSSEAVQKTFATTILKGTGSTRSDLLIALVGGLARDSPILSAYGEEPILRDEDLSGNLGRIVLLKSSNVPTYLSVQSQKISSEPSCETWLRLRELRPDFDEANVGLRIDDMLRMCETSPQLLTAVVERWLPSVSSVMNQPQKAKLVDMLCELTSTTDTWSSTLLTHANIMESDTLHDEIQRRLCEISKTSICNALQIVPVEFFHKAVRRQLVSLMATNTDQSLLQPLLKFSRAGYTHKFADENEFVKFLQSHPDREREGEDRAENTTLKLDSDGPCRVLRSMYIQSAEEHLCRSAIKLPGVSLSLMLEIMEDLSRRNVSDVGALWEDLLSFLVRNSSFRTSILSEDIEDDFKTAASDLVKLFRATFTTASPEAVGIAAKVHRTLCGAFDLSSEQTIRRFHQLAGKTQDRRLRLTLHELVFWPCDTAVAAFSVLQIVTSDASSSFAIKNWEGQAAAIVHRLSRKENYTLVSLLQQELQTEDTKKAIDVRLLYGSLVNQMASTFTLPLDQTDSEWLANQFATMCRLVTSRNHNGEKLTYLELDSIHLILTKYSRILDVGHIDILFETACNMLQNDAIDEDQVVIHKLLRSGFEHHAHLLRDRYHIVINLFSKMLSACQSKTTAESLVRLFTTFLSSCRSLSTTPEVFNKAISKHVPWLLIEYIGISMDTSTKQHLAPAVKRVLEEGLIYEIMGLCSTHEREMMGASLDSGGRGTFKRLYDEWNRFGKWVEK